MKVFDIVKSTIEDPNQKWIAENIQYLVLSGSHSYGTNTKDSDYDVVGFTIPPKRYVYPSQYGYIPGFSKDIPKFEQYQRQHLIVDGREYDITVYNIVKYFRLCLDNNPNMIETLFVDQDCLIKCTEIGDLVRTNRNRFLHKNCWFRFKGYAYSQLKKAKSKNRTGKRKEIVKQYGYDTKFAMHIFRLLDEVEQIFKFCDIDLRRNREELKAIRDGKYSLKEIEQKFNQRERYLEKLYQQRSLREEPEEDYIHSLLENCLSMWFSEQEISDRDRQESTRRIEVDRLINDIENVLAQWK